MISNPYKWSEDVPINYLLNFSLMFSLYLRRTRLYLYANT